MGGKIKFVRPEPAPAEVGTETKEDKPTTQEAVQPTPPPQVEAPSSDGVPVVSSDNPLSKVGGGAKRKRSSRAKDAAVPLDVEPMDSTPPSQDEPTTKGKRKSSKKSAKLSATMVSRQIHGFHAMAGVVFPGAEITKENADILAEEVVNTAEIFGFEPNEKLMAIVSLMATAIAVEAPVFINVRNTLRQRATQKTAVEAAMVINKQPIAVGNPTPRQAVTTTNVDEPGAWSND